ncbi:hypothetical protein J7E73_20605 [Paenibacillus albidus]|uniref:hypothetical protein n=1 Tax=Paenibacillus albidus TaxID=2041023 RepID=UPI001BEC2002|nr:hypothetical protein [Paenibacillus albidus]MBT2291479.1 hypothetical protein [Paenibacillus albidus]
MILLNILKLNIKAILKSYLFIVAFIIISIATYIQISPYFNYNPNLSTDDYNYLYQKYGGKSSNEIPVENESLNVPLTSEIERIYYAKKDLVFHLTKLTEENQITKGNLKIITKGLEQNDLKINEIDALVEKNTGMPGLFSFFYSNKHSANKGSEEYNHYATNKIADRGFAFFFGMKYREFLLLYMVFFMIVYIPINLFFFVKKENLEILRYKVKGHLSPIIENVLSLLIPLILILVVNNTFYSCLFMLKRLSNFSDILFFWLNSLVILAPLCFICALSLFVCSLFRNSIIIFPFLIGALLYSNFPETRDDGTIVWVVKPLSILIRYASGFWENSRPDFLYLNSAGLIILSIILVFSGSFLIRRRTNAF